ncbi:MAG: enolase C-terminal domain-like protein [Pseudomonadota bacterium]
MSKHFNYGYYDVAMRFSFRHASASRKRTCSFIVEITDSNGLCGYGEGCPREYVTGETIASVELFLKTYGQDFAWRINSLEELQSWIEQNAPMIDRNPAAFCALELAAIDLLAKQQQTTAEQLLGFNLMAEPARYTAVVGNSSVLTTRLITWAYRVYGLQDFKIKLSGQLQHDRRRLAVLPHNARYRVDANNLWTTDTEVIDYFLSLNTTPWAIEEPVAASDYQSLASVSAQLKTPVILDESLYTKYQLGQAVGHLPFAIANIRVSKCGGILRSVRLANRCLKAGYDVILGAQVGETSLLTRAALIVANGMTRPPIAREGAYGTILLKTDICQNSLKFKRSGLLSPDACYTEQQSGLGIDVMRETVKWASG